MTLNSYAMDFKIIWIPTLDTVIVGIFSLLNSKTESFNYIYVQNKLSTIEKMLKVDDISAIKDL